MGHWKRQSGKMEYCDTSFKEGAAITPVTVSDLSAGTKIKMVNKMHTYLGSTQHDPKDDATVVHHFQQSSTGDYKSYPTNSVPPMQARDTMENGDNSSTADNADQSSGS